ncbi:MAG: carbon-nitrogen hydrolase family protein [Acidithiobacillus sp.]|uniref:hypothetical protein n=1 Tax=Acidithiobacillus ferrooxidans TaxID=920 RepID=UPI0013D3017A|nr:hypothetical protein [Acidithiobacillus ferrooxidans]
MRSHRNRLSAIALPVLAALSGGLAWSPLGLFGLLPIFPLSYGFARTKRQQIAVVVGYYFGSLWSLEGVFDGFWPAAAPWVGLAGWTGAALLISAPWVLTTWLGPDTSILRGVRFLASLLLTALPPLGAYGLASPWIFAAAWFPGTGIIGLILGAIWLSMLATWSSELRTALDGVHVSWFHRFTPAPPTPLLTTTILVFGVMGALVANLSYRSPAAPAHWAVVHTDLPGFRGAVPAKVWELRQVRIAQIAMKAIQSHPQHTYILFPENIAGPQFPNFFSALMDHEMASMARAHGDTLLIGADDLAGRHDDYTDSLNIMGKYLGRISARQPVPLGEWRPWDRHTAVADWWHLGGYQLGRQTVAWAICYEQMLVWPVAWNFLGEGPQPTVLLAPSNHDWARHSQEPAVQKMALLAWARLYQVPVLYANNGPSKSNSSGSIHLAKRP